MTLIPVDLLLILRKFAVASDGAFRPFKVVQGHPRSMILVPIESAYTTSY